MINCELGNHQVEGTVQAQLINYKDAPNGITEEAYTCKTCYMGHVMTHYPESRLSKHFAEQIQKECDELGIE